MKALKIDSTNQTVTVIELGNDLQSIYDAIGNECSTFACPVTIPNGDTIYCDEEGLYHPFEGGFTFFGWDYPIVGNALIIGHDKNGTRADVKTYLEEVTSEIKWVSKEDAINWAKSVRYEDDGA